MNSPTLRRAGAVALGLTTHTLFAIGVTAMVLGLATGMRTGLGSLSGRSAIAANLALALQFPVLHSLALSRTGQRWLAAPWGRDLTTTVYAAFASVQVGATFLLWSPTGELWWSPSGALRGAFYGLYAAAWLLLGKAMWDSGLALQTGSLGWWAVARGRAPQYPPMPTRGLFAHWRQPIYTAFAATLLTGPDWGFDRVLIVLVWGVYCVLGPLHKEARYARYHGAAFATYRANHPYWLPRLRHTRAR